jgi:hypothetical protein
MQKLLFAAAFMALTGTSATAQHAPAAVAPLRDAATYSHPVHVIGASATVGVSRAGSIQVEPERGSRLSVVGGVAGFVLGAAVGTATACHFNRDSYGVYCLGQSDTKLAIGAVLGGAAGGALGAYLFRRSR